MKLTKFALFLLVLLVATAWQAPAQTWDTSGNGMLKGTYYFRQVIYLVSYDNGQLGEGTAIFGNINFSGSGTYTGSATVVDSSEGTGTIALSGTYSIAASGYGFISSPLVTGDFVYGLVNGSGIFVGSSTETADGYNDMFVAAPLSSPAPTAATFKGSYSIAGIDLTADLSNPGVALNYLMQVNPNGVSSLGTGSATVYIGEEGSNKYTQSLSSVTYSVSSGAIAFTLPTTNSGYIAGQKFLYISPDGNFVFGGGSSALDMFVGVRTGSGAPAFSGLYYQAGIDQLASGEDGELDTYYGSLDAVSGGNIVEHQRLLSPFQGAAFDYTFADTYSAPSGSGSYSEPAMNYVIGAGGERIGAGIGPYLGINVALPAPSFSGSGNGPYLNPTGIVNNASYAPFTAGISPGELIQLYGTSLADSPVAASGVPFPPMLGNVQVMINGVAAPIVYAYPTVIAAIVPFELAAGIAQVQVITDGNPSNTVTTYTNLTSAGVFSMSQNGLGYGAVEHADGSLVTTSSPAQIGETVSVYVAGLGAVTPAVADGTAGVQSSTTNTITADISGVAATISYCGLAPQYAGLYQVNLTIPTGLTNGDNALDIGGPDSYTSEVLISITGGAAAADRPAVRRAVPHIAKAVGPLPKRRPQ